MARLGFGCMRFPLADDGSIDEAQAQRMVDYALAHGVNYFDTAYPYHGGLSERVLGRVLAKYPREAYVLADKFPGHQIAERYDVRAVFEEQLERCGVDYFDRYLLHNVYEGSLPTYVDERWGIVEYLVEQKRAGRIKELGFSSHGRIENLREVLDLFPEATDFCQIQLNYLDWTMQEAKAKYELLVQRGIPVVVMEPVRGGKLANLPESAAARLLALRPQESQAAWALRWLQTLPEVDVVLSGMSNMAQLEDNVRTFTDGEPLTADEVALLLEIAEEMKGAVPCTSCRYCCDSCPQQLDIPRLVNAYSDLQIAPTVNIGMWIDSLPEDKRPDACIACGACAAMCPQGIDIPGVLEKLAQQLARSTGWAEICRQRDAAQKENAGK